jgi:hypothetical protein
MHDGFGKQADFDRRSALAKTKRPVDALKTE